MWRKQTIEAIRKLNGCDAEGKPSDKYCALYASKNGTPVVAYIHPGGHALPRLGTADHRAVLPGIFAPVSAGEALATHALPEH